MKTIVLTGGGTAGHVFGNIALLPKLEKAFDRIVYLGSENGIEREIIKQHKNVEYVPIKTIKLERKLTLKNLAIPFVLLKSISNCKKILKEINPNIIFSKGGFVSIPVVFAGSKLKIPIVCHESDLTLGLSNKLTKNKAKYVCTTFPKTAQKLKNGLWVGSPIRENLFSGNQSFRQKFKISTNAKVLLVMGGSLGSNDLNKLVWNNLEFLCSNFFVVHLTGKEKSKNITHSNYAQLEFCNEMQNIFAITDFAITRGGSNAIWELVAMKIPMLIIPLSKKISRGDQIENAKYFEDCGFSLTLFDESISDESFKAKVKELSSKKDLIKQKLNEVPKKNSLDIIFNTIIKYSKDIN